MGGGRARRAGRARPAVTSSCWPRGLRGRRSRCRANGDRPAPGCKTAIDRRAGAGSCCCRARRRRCWTPRPSSSSSSTRSPQMTVTAAVVWPTRLGSPASPSPSSMTWSASRRARRAIAFERPLWGRGPEIRLGVEDSLLADLAVGLRTIGPGAVAGRAGRATAASVERAPRGPSDGEIAHRHQPPATGGPGEAAMRHMVAHQPPRLPELTPRLSGAGSSRSHGRRRRPGCSVVIWT